MKLLCEWHLPIRTVSEANNSEHWTAKRKRKQIQKRWVDAAFLKEKKQFPENLKINLTRIAPRMLDIGDNLPMSFKTIRDQIAANLRPNLAPGRADDDERLVWGYHQEKGKPKEYAIKILIFENDTTLNQN